MFKSKTKTFDEIGKIFNCSGDVISRVLNEADVDTSRIIKLTEQEIQKIVNDYTFNKLGTTTLARKYSYSASFINKMLKANNVTMESRRIPTLTLEQELDIIKKHTENGMTLYQISKEIGINDYYISQNIFKKHNISFIQRTPAKDKLNIPKIINDFNLGKGVATIARENSSSYSTINNILIENGIKTYIEIPEIYDEKFVVIKIDKKYSFNDFQTNFIIEKYKEKYPITSISIFFKVDYNSIHKLLTKNNIKVGLSYFIQT